MHGLAIKKHATPEAVAGILGLDAERRSGRRSTNLSRPIASSRRKGRYLLTPAARMALDSDYSLSL